MNFLRKILKLDRTERDPPAQARGAAPMQSPEEQDATRARMEAEMEEQRQRREAGRTET